MKTLALFDFDHTLYKKDSLLELTKAIVGTKRFYFGILKLSPYLVAMTFGLLKNANVKTKYLTHFFGGKSYEVFSKAAQQFATAQIEKDLDPVLYKKLKEHIEHQDIVYIVTASSTEWIAPFAEKYGIKLISSELEVQNGIITGRLCGNNCYGPEKVKRIKLQLILEEFDCIKVYGKGKGDAEMLSLMR